jgi:hypothetical protein
VFDGDEPEEFSDCWVVIFSYTNESTKAPKYHDPTTELGSVFVLK